MAQSISQLVSPYANFQCVATCATANEVVDAINKYAPHIVLMGGNWLESFRQANSKLTRSRSRATNWAIVDPRVDHHVYVEASQLGIHYLFQTKCTMPIPRDETDEIILSLLTVGWTNKQIADQACLSIQTVKNRLSRMMKQSGASNRTELVVRIVG
jgi:DNA-binding NarL/FixJ family response regulator